MLGDYLIESRCARGHTSSAAFRRYTREQVEHVARQLADRCAAQVGADEFCAARVAHVISVVAEPRRASAPPQPAAQQPPRIATKPSMTAVVIVNDHEDAACSTEPPPPSSDGWSKG